MHQAYVSEYERFMAQFMAEHPLEHLRQRDGWRSFWEVEITPADLEPHPETLARDDQYGFR